MVGTFSLTTPTATVRRQPRGPRRRESPTARAAGARGSGRAERPGPTTPKSKALSRRVGWRGERRDEELVSGSEIVEEWRGKRVRVLLATEGHLEGEVMRADAVGVMLALEKLAP